MNQRCDGGSRDGGGSGQDDDDDDEDNDEDDGGIEVMVSVGGVPNSGCLVYNWRSLSCTEIKSF